MCKILARVAVDLVPFGSAENADRHRYAIHHRKKGKEQRARNQLTALCCAHFFIIEQDEQQPLRDTHNHEQRAERDRHNNEQRIKPHARQSRRRCRRRGEYAVQPQIERGINIIAGQPSAKDQSNDHEEIR